MIAKDTVRAVDHPAATRFYRPELDALRFFAFLAVLVHHGPVTPGFLKHVRTAGGFGLSMFFVLSAYLITELLLREREQTGTVSWRLFFIRRTLRIWPLYFAALAIGIVVCHFLPPRYGITGRGIVAMSFFVGNAVSVNQIGPVFGPLWSISVEEQFYLIWPPIVKAGGKRLAFAAAIFFVVCSAAWLRLFHANGRVWYDTPLEFVFFAAGAGIALATHGRRPPQIHSAIRGCLLLTGLYLLFIAGFVGGVADDIPRLTIKGFYLGYGEAVAGCVLVFVALLGFTRVPRALTYWGKISYGLYVFHAGILLSLMWLAARLKLSPQSVLNMFAVDTVALLLCIVAAHFSYQYFEMRFLKLKERFAVIESRPA